jgi:tetratricopeptide (TPR) repeat protein
VCFGPVVTAVSPLSELRGSFSWARTAFHEFTHVIHLGLSHNRCPRWITEGLATWEEENANSHWTRNMRRELIDALANDDLIRVRDLNRAFRGSRILFGYFQSGIVCRLLIERAGFPPMVRLLEAFDRGADLDRALSEVYRTTPEELDLEVERFVRAQVAGLSIEPRWSDASVQGWSLILSRTPPEAGRELWVDDTCSLAWGLWQRGRKVDAEQTLLRLEREAIRAPRAEFLRGEMAASRSRPDQARAHWEKGLELGGDDFRVRRVLGQLAADADEPDVAERHLRRAEELFPGHEDRDFAAELALAAFYSAAGRDDEALAARERWLEWNDDDALLLEVAAAQTERGRSEAAARSFERANQIDPFRRTLHERWADALEGAGRPLEAARELLAATLVPTQLDRDEVEPLTGEQRAELLARRAKLLWQAGAKDEARAALRAALEADPDNAAARELLEQDV